MFSETFITAILAQPKTQNTAIDKDNGVYQHSLYPTHTISAIYKKSSVSANCLAINDTHIFAAQADKAQVLVYSRETRKQEALVAFPERIRSLCMVHQGLLALGTAEGRIILWEVNTGRQISTPTSHLQPVVAIAATVHHLISASEDSNIHVWCLPTLLSLSTSETTIEPLRTLSNHRAPITSLTVGHTTATTNLLISTAKDNTVLVWNYHAGTLLHTFLLPSIPLSCALDPADRAIYLGLTTGQIQRIDLLDPHAAQNMLYNPSLQQTPTQPSRPPFTGAPTEPPLGPTNALSLSYDGTILLSAHDSGKLIQWDVGPQAFLTELADHNAPITNLQILPAIPSAEHGATRRIKAEKVVKPKLGDNMGRDYAIQGYLVGETASTEWRREFEMDGFSSELLDEVVLEFQEGDGAAAGASGSQLNASGDLEKLRKENEDLKKIVKEMRPLIQKRTFDKIT